ncbi:MAG TPA: elongation factor Ts [Saprospirales bacterium]|nr:elongation factor Ts [Saprospirales bacterium]HAY70628.1 elongation factor Ts [Saprospirales bacterium]HRQ30715.1 translation elongation factor Ts [Saprospiraceae bacterium]
MSETVISAAVVKQLRDQTGIGMMDCKKALEESNGDFELAVEYLRKKGQKVSAKRADREAKEGVVIALVSDDHTKGIVVKLSSETDFVAKNEDFIDLTRRIASHALNTFFDDKESLLDSTFESVTLRDKIMERVAAIGEKIELANYEKIEAPLVVSYIHMGNKAGVILGLNKTGDNIVEAGKNVAMQVAAMHPIAVDESNVDASIVAKEIEIGKEQARAEGKPEEMLEKIAIGKLNKFYKESTLINQAYVKDGKVNVQQYLSSVDKDLKVTGFKHVKLG